MPVPYLLADELREVGIAVPDLGALRTHPRRGEVVDILVLALLRPYSDDVLLGVFHSIPRAAHPRLWERLVAVYEQLPEAVPRTRDAVAVALAAAVPGDYDAVLARLVVDRGNGPSRARFVPRLQRSRLPQARAVLAAASADPEIGDVAVARSAVAASPVQRREEVFSPVGTVWNQSWVGPTLATGGMLVTATVAIAASSAPTALRVTAGVMAIWSALIVLWLLTVLVRRIRLVSARGEWWAATEGHWVTRPPLTRGAEDTTRTWVARYWWAVIAAVVVTIDIALLAALLFT